MRGGPDGLGVQLLVAASLQAYPADLQELLVEEKIALRVVEVLLLGQLIHWQKVPVPEVDWALEPKLELLGPYYLQPA